MVNSEQRQEVLVGAFTSMQRGLLVSVCLSIRQRDF